MVVDSPPDDRTTLVFHALGDATRRDIVRRAMTGRHSVSHLARAYPMSFTAVHKHVAVLERAGLVHKERQGREQIVHTDVAALAAARLWLDEVEVVWRDRMSRIGDVLADTPQGEPR
jgi:DNA-binding transcriptional ArsR family regulator